MKRRRFFGWSVRAATIAALTLVVLTILASRPIRETILRSAGWALVLIILSRILGQLMLRFGQPAIAGEMFAGVFLGPAVLNLIQPNQALAGISELAVFLIVLSAGLEMKF